MIAVTSPPNGRDPVAALNAELWWVLALRGGLAIVVGMITLAWPVTALLALTLVFAAYNLMEGVFSIVLAVRAARSRKRWLWPALHGMVALGAAALVVLFPEVTMLLFVALLIAWALFNGVFAIVAALRLGRARGRGWLVANGVVSLILAALLLAWPSAGLFTVTWMFAFYVMAAGVSLLGLALRLRWIGAGG